MRQSTAVEPITKISPGRSTTAPRSNLANRGIAEAVKIIATALTAKDAANILLFASKRIMERPKSAKTPPVNSGTKAVIDLVSAKPPAPSNTRSSPITTELMCWELQEVMRGLLPDVPAGCLARRQL